MRHQLLPLVLPLAVAGLFLAARADDPQPARPTDRPSVVNVRDRGARGDGKADDTAAIRAAIDAAPPGGVVYFPCGRYRTTATLTIAKPLTLRGDATHGGFQGYFGDAAYAAIADPGSVLESEMRDGALIEHLESRSDPKNPGLNLRVVDLHLKGLGGASRTTVGLRVGSRKRGGICTLRGVRVSNFKVGVALTFVENSTIDDLWVYGCDTGMLCDGPTTANTITNFNASGCGDAVVMKDGGKNVILGGAIQSSRRTGIVLGGEENSVRDVYFESSESRYAIDVQPAGGCHVIDSCHFGAPGDRVRIGVTGCRIFPSKYMQSLEITPAAARTQVIGPWFGALADRGQLTSLVAPLTGPRPASAPASAPATMPATRSARKSAEIRRGQRTVTVEHGLGGEPRLEDVGVMSPGAAPVWLAGASAKSLTFRTNAPAPPAGISFVWSATLR